MRLYFETLLHPAKKTVYTNPPNDSNINSTLKLKLIQHVFDAIACHIIITKIKATIGLTIKKASTLLLFTSSSLLSNFNPSKIGCRIPFILVLFTPIRVCLKPRTFRSNNV